jgi:hypothetical protein
MVLGSAGTFSVQGQTLTFVTDPSGPSTFASSFYVSSTKLVETAMYPDGQHDGVVGNWVLHSSSSGGGGMAAIESTQRFELHADHTVTARFEQAGQMTTSAGTFTQPDTDTADVSLATDSGQPPTVFTLFLVDDAVLGFIPMHRLF